ncbi:MAG TPA: hypothetical protein VKY74_05800 [Chloroflexia bacterium]|nr:hypothetical protein [Chloroflexia bacterium]
MDEHPELPHWTPTDALWVVATQLRQAVFRHQTQAARHFGRASTTISRYEAYAADGPGLKPPFGYLAALAALWAEQLRREGARPAAVEGHLVQQLEALRRRFYGEDAAGRPLRTWVDLVQVAAAYQAERVPPQEFLAPPATAAAGVVAPESAPPSLYAQLDRGIYQGLVTLMRGDGARLRELLLLGGLTLGTGLILGEVFVLPADAADQGALLHGAVGLVVATTILPLLLGGGAIHLEVRRRPEWRHLRGGNALGLTLLAYGGAGYGVLTALALGGLGALLIHNLNFAPLWLAALLRGGILLTTVALGLVFAGRSMDGYARYTQMWAAPAKARLGRTELLMGASIVLVGPLNAIFLVTFYDLLLARGVGLGLLAAALMLAAVWGAGAAAHGTRPLGQE